MLNLVFQRSTIIERDNAMLKCYDRGLKNRY